MSFSALDFGCLTLTDGDGIVVFFSTILISLVGYRLVIGIVTISHHTLACFKSVHTNTTFTQGSIHYDAFL